MMLVGCFHVQKSDKLRVSLNASLTRLDRDVEVMWAEVLALVTGTVRLCAMGRKRVCTDRSTRMTGSCSIPVWRPNVGLLK